MSHRCDTCQGLGCLTCTGFHSCEQPHNYCQVCNGSGTLPDQMPVSDALADAETLSRYAHELGSRYKVARAVFESGNLGYRTLDSIKGYTSYAGAFQFADMGALLAARAAFRAVPALRGE